MHLYLVTDAQNVSELDDDDETVEHCKIQDGDKLYLLIYKWLRYKNNVPVMKTGRKLWGLEKDDTCLGVKVKAQDQTGTPVRGIRLVRLAEYEWEQRVSFHVGSHTFVQKYKKLTEISDEQFPFNYKEPLSIVTEEELKAEPARVEQEKKAWLEGLTRRGYQIL